MFAGRAVSWTKEALGPVRFGFAVFFGAFYAGVALSLLLVRAMGVDPSSSLFGAVAEAAGSFYLTPFRLLLGVDSNAGTPFLMLAVLANFWVGFCGWLVNHWFFGTLTEWALERMTPGQIWWERYGWPSLMTFALPFAIMLLSSIIASGGRGAG